MKVITEERLRELLSLHEGQDQDVAGGLNLAIEGCKEIDTLTVSKLRQMCDAPKNGRYILACNNSNNFDKVFFNTEYERWFLPDSRACYSGDKLRGWLPMPVYKPWKK